MPYIGIQFIEPKNVAAGFLPDEIKNVRDKPGRYEFSNVRAIHELPLHLLYPGLDGEPLFVQIINFTRKL
jgi:hypothetical protein